MPLAIETIALTKQYPRPRGWRGLLARQSLGPPAVDRVDLRVQQGELFGLLGPNGAGKTTLIKLLSTLVIPTSGQALVNGYPLHAELAIKGSIGLATSDERSFYWRLSGRQNLEFFGALHGLDAAQSRRRTLDLLQQVGLGERGDEPFQTYSSGMRQRLIIARALLNRPPLLFLDEPTRGLDPAAAAQVQTLVRELCDRDGITVFLTTHNLPEAKLLCDRIAILDHGQVQACGTLAELGSLLDLDDRYRLEVRGLQPAIQERLRQALVGVQIGAQAGAAETTVEFTTRDGDGALDRALGLVREAGGQVESIYHEPPALETIFARIVGGRIVAGEGQGQPAPASVAPLETMPVAQPAAPSGTQGFASIRIAAAFLKRDLLTEASYRFSFLLQFANTFFSAAVFYFISRLLGPAAAPLLSAYGGDYFSFVLIGIAFAGYFGVGLSSFANNLRQAQTTGTLEAMLATPTGLSTIIVSSSLWDFLLTTLRVVVYLGLGAGLMGVNLGRGNYPAAALTLLLTVTVFSSLGILAASFIMVLKRGDPITWAFNALFSLLGGVYYPISVLPGWMQTLSGLIPMTYALRAMRLALLQGTSTASLAPDLLALAGFTLALLPLSLLAFRYAVRRARVEGSLAHY